MAHFPARPRREFSVQMQLHFRLGAGRDPVGLAMRPQRSPNRLAMAEGRSISVEPSGSPQTARNCCSNWLVTLASKVKCPELCGRGASSLMSRRPPGSTKEFDAQHADHAQGFEHRAGDLARFTDHVRRNLRRGDGHIQDVMLVTVFDHAPVGEGSVRILARRLRIPRVRRK